MKKFTFIVLATACFVFNARSQDFGYRTTDIGAEYIWVENSPGVNLQFASNSKMHHSFVASIGYKYAYRPISGTHNNEEGHGWGGSIGYRYYFTVLPKGLFLGLRGQLWSMGMYKTADISKNKTALLVGQPSAETGYTALINDMFFITGYISAGKQVTLNSPTESFGYGNGSVIAAGISAGFRF